MKIDFILEDLSVLFNDSREGIDRITSIVQNLRDFSRKDEPENFDIYNINDGVKATLVVVQNEIKYDTDVETELSEVPQIFCSSGQINQVLLNILMNAAQAIKSQERDDKGKIAIRTYATDDNVVCEISDDGPGIEPDELQKIFDPFFTTKPVGKGTGLGLSISYDIIVNKHKGILLVDNSIGNGTKFTIKLPISKKENNGNKDSIICG
jgi:signal transduction histidine kinase